MSGKKGIAVPMPAPRKRPFNATVPTDTDGETVEVTKRTRTGRKSARSTEERSSRGTTEDKEPSGDYDDDNYQDTHNSIQRKPATRRSRYKRVVESEVDEGADDDDLMDQSEARVRPARSVRKVVSYAEGEY